jgi:hypothetical protein
MYLPTNDSSWGPRARVCNDDAFRELLVKWIVENNQPFSEVGHPAFHDVIFLLKPDAKMLSKDTARRDIGKLFKEEKECVCAML